MSGPSTKQHKPDHHDQKQDGSAMGELREQLSMRAAVRNQLDRSSQKKAALRPGEDPEGDNPFAMLRSIATEGEKLDGPDRSRARAGASDQDRAIDEQNRERSQDKGISTFDGAGNQNQTSTNIDDPALQVTPNQSTEAMLESLVGVDASMTLREKLRELGVLLDAEATTELDVMARLPVTLQGETAREFFMIRSPQRVFFMEFIRNQNDWFLIGVFDRRALLPSDLDERDELERQALIEGGIMALVQIKTVAKLAKESMQDKLSKLVEDPSVDAKLIEGLRKRILYVMRRIEACGRMEDELRIKLEAILESSYAFFDSEDGGTENQQSGLRLVQSKKEAA